MQKRSERFKPKKKKFVYGQQSKPDNLPVNRNGIPVLGEREPKVRNYPGED